MRMRALCLPVVMTLSACASTPDGAVPTTVNSKALSAQTLAPGDCGLFVWSADMNKRFTLFSRAKTNAGVWYGPDGETPISLSSQSGETTNGQSPQQEFASAGLNLVLRRPEVITQGTRYKQGTLTQLSPEGWDIVTPVVGLSMCQT